MQITTTWNNLLGALLIILPQHTIRSRDNWQLLCQNAGELKTILAVYIFKMSCLKMFFLEPCSVLGPKPKERDSEIPDGLLAEALSCNAGKQQRKT